MPNLHPALQEGTPHSEWHLNRLKASNDKHGRIIVGVDFDWTLKDHTDILKYYDDTVALVKRAQSQGNIICIWTANQDPEQVKQELAGLGLSYDYFNDSPLKYDSRKAHFNILLDDIAGLGQCAATLSKFLDNQWGKYT